MPNISFYSYKGGSGRTTTTLNTVFYLIRELRPTPSKPIIIIDADTESYGMSMLLLRDCEKLPGIDCSLQYLALRATQDEFLSGGDSTEWLSYRKLHKYFVPVGGYFTRDVENDAVLLLRSDVTPKEQRESWGSVFSLNNTGDKSFDNFNELLKVLRLTKCSVVFDTPSGTQDFAELALNSSQTIVCCMRPSIQFEQGTRLCFEKFIETWRGKGAKKNIIFCPSAVPYKQINIDSEVYPDYYMKTTYAGFRNELQTKANSTNGNIEIVWDMRDGSVPGIPEVQRFKWQECCLEKVASDEEDERLAKEKYAMLARLIRSYTYN